MEESINEAIRENLPTAVGEVLRARLEEVDSLEAENESLRQELEQAQTDGEKWKLEAEEYWVNIVAQEELDEKLEEVKERERRVDLEEFKVQAAETRVEDMKEVVGMVFANSRFKYQETTQRTIPQPEDTFLTQTQETREVEGEQ